MTHTPTPWKAANIGDQGWTILAGDTIVAIVGGGGNGEDFDPAYEADARLIASAANSHDALIARMEALEEALRAALEAIEYLGNYINEADFLTEEDEDFVNPLIAKARAPLSETQVEK
jgi:hypothetical protein